MSSMNPFSLASGHAIVSLGTLKGAIQIKCIIIMYLLVFGKFLEELLSFSDGYTIYEGSCRATCSNT